MPDVYFVWAARHICPSEFFPHRMYGATKSLLFQKHVPISLQFQLNSISQLYKASQSPKEAVLFRLRHLYSLLFSHTKQNGNSESIGTILYACFKWNADSPYICNIYMHYLNELFKYKGIWVQLGKYFRKTNNHDFRLVSENENDMWYCSCKNFRVNKPTFKQTEGRARNLATRNSWVT